MYEFSALGLGYIHHRHIAHKTNRHGYHPQKFENKPYYVCPERMRKMHYDLWARF